jgi:hypothetical protein
MSAGPKPICEKISAKPTRLSATPMRAKASWLMRRAKKATYTSWMIDWLATVSVFQPNPAMNLFLRLKLCFAVFLFGLLRCEDNLYWKGIIGIPGVL